MPHAHRTLARKFFWRFVPSVMAVLVVVAVLNLRLSISQEHQRTMEMRENLVSLYAASLEKPLWDVDLIAARGIVATMAGIPDVEWVRLSEQADGSSITAGRLPPDEQSASIREIIYRDENGREHPVGRMEIEFRQLAWTDTLRQGLSAYGAIFLASLVTILFTAGWAFRDLVTGPLGKFRQTIESQKLGENSALPEPEIPADELGDVMRAYLSLLHRVQSSIDRRDALRKCAGYLLEPSSSPQSFTRVLDVIRGTLLVDFVQLYEWSHRPGQNFLRLLESSGEAGGSRLPETLADPDFQDLLAAIRPGEVFGVPPRSFSSRDESLFRRFGMASPALVLFQRRGDHSLLLVLAQCETPRAWSDYEQAFLKTAADMIESHLLRNEAEREIQTGRDRLRVITDNIPDAFLFQFTVRGGSERAFTYVSDGIRRVLGLQPEDVERNVFLVLDLVDLDYRGPLFAAQEESRLHLSDFFFETPVNLPDGRRRWAQLSSRPQRMPDGSVVWQGIHRDITEAREAEEQLQKSRDDLASANAALEKAIHQAEELAREAAEANSAKSEFIANMSHEIRTPMNAIIGFSEILSGSLREPENRDKALLIADSGRQLLSLVDDILDLSKIEAGQIEFRPLAFSPVALLQDLRQFFGEIALQKGLDLSLDLASDLPGEIVSDELRLRQVLMNLVSNAIKFTSAGSVTLRAFLPPPASDTEARSICFEVLDTGPGIPLGAREKIFENFAQLAPSGLGGAGLGLSISRRLTTLLGGTISVTDNPHGPGSLFSVHVPLSDAVDAVSDSPSVVQEPAGIIFDHPPLVLIVDDGRVNRGLLRAYLSGYGFEVIEACDGHEALQQVALHRPGIILTDIRMPGLDGRELFRRLRADSDPVIAAIPVIAVTAAPMLEQSLEDRKLFDGFLFKPVSRTDVIEELARFLPHRRIDVEARQAFMDETFIDSIDVLRDEITDELEALAISVKKHLRIKDAIELGRRLKAIGDRRGIPALTSAGESLEEAARSFRIDRIRHLLDEFFTLRARIQNHPGTPRP